MKGDVVGIRAGTQKTVTVTIRGERERDSLEEGKRSDQVAEQ